VLNDADEAKMVAQNAAAKANPALDLDLEEREKNKQTPNIQKTPKHPN